MSGFLQIHTQSEHFKISDHIKRGKSALAPSKSQHLVIIVQNNENQIKGLDGFESYLAENWDGEGAQAISPKTLKNATHFLARLPARLPAVDACPGVDGSIGFEWETSAAYLYIDIKPDERVLYYYKLWGTKGLQKDKAVIPAPFVAQSLYERLKKVFDALRGQIKFEITAQMKTYVGLSKAKREVKQPKLTLYNISGIKHGIRRQI